MRRERTNGRGVDIKAFLGPLIDSGQTESKSEEQGSLDAAVIAISEALGSHDVRQAVQAYLVLALDVRTEVVYEAGRLAEQSAVMMKKGDLNWLEFLSAIQDAEEDTGLKSVIRGELADLTAS